jgi:hypothetical protein
MVMNRHERRAAASVQAAAAGHLQQECKCGWLAPREAYAEIMSPLPAPARVTIVVICPVCGTRFDRTVDRSANA